MFAESRGNRLLEDVEFGEEEAALVGEAGGEGEGVASSSILVWGSGGG